MTCKVIATKAELTSVGIDRDLTNQEVEYVLDYDGGYSKIRVEATEDVRELFGDEAEQEVYDIPKRWLSFT